MYEDGKKITSLLKKPEYIYSYLIRFTSRLDEGDIRTILKIFTGKKVLDEQTVITEVLIHLRTTAISKVTQIEGVKLIFKFKKGTYNLRPPVTKYGTWMNYRDFLNAMEIDTYNSMVLQTLKNGSNYSFLWECVNTV